MKLQISTDYALRILRHLHRRRNDDVQTAMSIAEAIGITYPFFIKIANQLKRAGLIKSLQGRHGGYILGKSAHEISLYDVLLCVEGEMQIIHCLKDSQRCTYNTVGCKLRKVFHTVQSNMAVELSSVSIADVA